MLDIRTSFLGLIDSNLVLHLSTFSVLMTNQNRFFMNPLSLSHIILVYININRGFENANKISKSPNMHIISFVHISLHNAIHGNDLLRQINQVIHPHEQSFLLFAVADYGSPD